MAEPTLKPGWRVLRFERIAIMVNDRVEPADAEVDYYVGLEHLDPDSLRIRRWGSPSDVEATKLLFRKGDIIFGRRRVYQRKLAVADFDGICSAHAMVLRPKTDVVLPEFLPFFMQSDCFMSRALKISVGSLSPTINWRTLAKQQFALPPLEEQYRICDLLLAEDDLLDTLICALQEATLVWRSVSANEFRHVDQIDMESLADHYSIESGQVNPTEDEYTNLPLIAPNHVESETGVLLSLETAGQQKAISGKYLFEAGAVVYSKIRPNLMKAVIAPCRGLCSADMYPLVPEPTIRGEYLLEILLSDRFTEFAVSGSMRTGMPKVNRKYLSRYRCRVPELDKQDRYLEVAVACRSAREGIAGRISGAREVKAAVLREMLGRQVSPREIPSST